MHRLVPHLHSPPGSIDHVSVQLALDEPRELWLEYTVGSAHSLFLPEECAPRRADELWKTTCFELFIQPVGSDSYFEYNFSPSFEWAAYAFAGYRSGRQDLPAHDPEIAVSPADEWYFLAVEALPELPPAAVRIGVSAVIEETDGAKSYWALAHPPEGPPDFHHPDCFVLELPPPAGT